MSSHNREETGKQKRQRCEERALLRRGRQSKVQVYMVSPHAQVIVPELPSQLPERGSPLSERADEHGGGGVNLGIVCNQSQPQDTKEMTWDLHSFLK